MLNDYIIIERLRCEGYAKMVCFNCWPNVTATRREVEIPGSSVAINETLREMMRIQQLQRSK